MSIYDYTVKDRSGNDISMSDFKGKVLLIVNTATGCGFTPQYEGLEKLLVDREGNVVERYEPTITPEKIEAKIKELI